VSDEEEDKERLPKVPEVPPLPEVPELKPQLPAQPKPSREPDQGLYQKMGLAYALPIVLITPIVVLTVGGWWMDEQLKSSPGFTIGGAVLGVIVGFINMIRIANRLQ
jgi:F0F1-type ATP synthase assembly protein I